MARFGYQTSLLREMGGCAVLEEAGCLLANQPLLAVGGGTDWMHCGRGGPERATEVGDAGS